MSNVPQDTAWSWMICAGVWLAFFVFGSVRTLGIIIKELESYFQVSATVSIMVSASQTIFYTICAPIGVLLGERWGQRSVIMIAGIFGALGISLATLCYSVSFVIGTFGIMFGASTGLMIGNIIVALTQHFTKWRSLATGLAFTGSSVGSLILPFLVQFIIDLYSLPGVFLILAGLVLNLVVVGALIRPPSFYPPDTKTSPTNEANRVNLNKQTSRDELNDIESDSEVDQKLAGDISPSKIKTSKLSLPNSFAGEMYTSMTMLDENWNSHWNDAKTRGSSDCCLKCQSYCSRFVSFPVICYSVVTLFAFSGSFNVILFIPLHSRLAYLSAHQFVLLLVTVGASDLIGRIITGIIGDRQYITRYKLQAIALVLGGFNGAIFLFANSFAWAVVHCFIFGIFFSTYLTLISVVMADLFGMENLSRGFSLVLLAQGIGVSSLNIILGVIRDQFRSTDGVFSLCGIFMAIGGTILGLHPTIHSIVKKCHRRVESQSPVMD